MKIDKNDLKILAELDIDAKQSYSKIGIKINQSKQYVKYRIKRLEKEKIIKNYKVDINLRKLGYMIFNVFFRLKNINAENKIFEFFKETPEIGYFLKTLGNWDCFISLKCKNINELYLILDEIRENFSSEIIEERINLEITANETNLKILSADSNPSFFETMGKIANNNSLKKLEKKIMDKLRKNPLINYINLEKDLKKNYETIIKAIKKLKKEGILRRIRAEIDIEKIGYERYLILIKTNFSEKKVLKKISNSIKNNKNINYFIECIGNWNIICSIYTKNTEEFTKSISELKNDLKNNISSIELLKVVENKKEHFMMTY